MDAGTRTSEMTSRPRGAGISGARGVFCARQRPSQPAGHVVMFWVLTGIATAIFAPCVLMPVWIEAAEVHAYEQSLAEVIGGLEAQIAENDARMEALRTDPLVNDRISRRELNHRREGEQITRFSPGESQSFGFRGAEMPGSETEQAGEPAPGWLLAIREWLPDWPWRELFAESPNRTIMLLMAAGLLFSAFFLYGQPIWTKPHSTG